MNCTVCSSVTTKQCANCATPYCSRECQRVDWVSAHKRTCNANANANSAGRLLITAPHAGCSEQPCDITAEALAIRVHALMPAESTLMINRRPRAHVDMNRAESRSTEWRRQLTEQLRSGNYSRLIDVHSYPGEGFGVFAVDVDVTLLPTPTTDPARLESLVRAFATRNITVIVLEGDPITNDIVRQSGALGVSALLIEVNDTRATPDKLDRIAAAVSSGY